MLVWSCANYCCNITYWWDLKHQGCFNRLNSFYQSVLKFLRLHTSLIFSQKLSKTSRTHSSFNPVWSPLCFEGFSSRAPRLKLSSTCIIYLGELPVLSTLNKLLYYIKYSALKRFRALIKVIISHVRLFMIISHVKIIAFL